MDGGTVVRSSPVRLPRMSTPRGVSDNISDHATAGSHHRCIALLIRSGLSLRLPHVGARLQR